jgi:hypothetical protein
MITFGELERTDGEEVVAYFKVLLRPPFGGTEKNHENFQQLPCSQYLAI